MSNRRRSTRAAPATRRPPVRQLATRRPPRRPPATPPQPPATPGRATPWLLALLAVGAEAGHLAAAFLEWPGAPARGVHHVLVGALLGLVAALATDRGGTVRTVAAATVGLLGPTAWLVGALAGVAVYQTSPLPLAVAVTGTELVLVTGLSGLWTTPGVPVADHHRPA